MNSRIELHELLCSLMKEPHVYFQPPPNIRMVYPAIRYEISDRPRKNAGNVCYTLNHEYKITVIDKNPESEIVEQVARLPRCRSATHFTQEGLNHDIFYLYY